MILNFTLTDEETFWTKVDIRGSDECWDWMGAKAHGYGKYTLQNGMTIDARYVASGTVDYSSLVWPVCGNRACCNPAHLRVSTHEDRYGIKRKTAWWYNISWSSVAKIVQRKTWTHI